MNKPILILSCIAVSLLTSCAGSAEHEAVKVRLPTDEKMTCTEIKAEKKKLQTIIDGVNRDKEDLTGKDVVDGLLWFPFNLIAKDSNYNNAIKAANERQNYLNGLAKGKGCNPQRKPS